MGKSCALPSHHCDVLCPASGDLCQAVSSPSNFRAKYGDKHQSQEMLPHRGKVLLIHHLVCVIRGSLALFATQEGNIMRRPISPVRTQQPCQTPFKICLGAIFGIPATERCLVGWKHKHLPTRSGSVCRSPDGADWKSLLLQACGHSPGPLPNGVHLQPEPRPWR